MIEKRDKIIEESNIDNNRLWRINSIVKTFTLGLLILTSRINIGFS